MWKKNTENRLGRRAVSLRVWLIVTLMCNVRSLLQWRFKLRSSGSRHHLVLQKDTNVSRGSFTMKMEATRFSKMLVSYHNTTKH